MPAFSPGLLSSKTKYSCRSQQATFYICSPVSNKATSWGSVHPPSKHLKEISKSSKANVTFDSNLITKQKIGLMVWVFRSDPRKTLILKIL